jgi:hypothetical protein
MAAMPENETDGSWSSTTPPRPADRSSRRLGVPRHQLRESRHALLVHRHASVSALDTPAAVRHQPMTDLPEIVVDMTSPVPPFEQIRAQLATLIRSGTEPVAA